MPTLYTVLRAQHRHAPAVSQYVGRRAPHHGYPGHTSLDAQRKALLKHFTRLQRASFRDSPNRKVVIVGAGLAGLSAAYELKKLGYDVHVYEARHRVGGRAFSFRFGRKIVEGGGELIGRNHPLWCGYAQNFKLHFSDVFEYGNSPVRMNGRTISFEESKALTDAMEPHMERLNHLADSIVDPFEPWINANSAWLDKTSLADWLASIKCRTKESKQGLAAVEQQLVADNGRSAEKQSLLGILAMIKGHGVDRYWTDTEVYRCVGGNAQLANCFQEELGTGVVHTGITVTGIFEQKGIVSVELAYTTEEDLEKDLEPGSPKPFDPKKLKKLKPVQADEVILAVPPSVWHLIDFKNKDLQARLSKAPELGVNTKNLFVLKKRFWQSFASSPTLTDSKGPADMTWETTEDTKHPKKTNKKPDFAFVAFSGADHSQELVGLGSDEAREAALRKQLTSVYPGIEAQIKKSIFMNWPGKHFSQGSYYFPAPNEVTAWGPFWKTGYLNWLHFAGEYTSYAFMGYMEGALSSGFRLAHSLAVRDKLLP